MHQHEIWMIIDTDAFIPNLKKLPYGGCECLPLLTFFSFQGLSFRKGTHELFSVSHDRSVKLWNVDELAYIETL